jgi:hypothetical protein
MANAKVRNVVIVGTNGIVAIASGTGELTIESADKLPPNIARLIIERQKLGKQLSDALIRTNYPVDGGSSECDVLDPTLAFARLSRKKGRKKRTKR